MILFHFLVFMVVDVEINTSVRLSNHCETDCDAVIPSFSASRKDVTCKHTHHMTRIYRKIFNSNGASSIGIDHGVFLVSNHFEF
jgi:hypothetical protein